jgi:membrane-associated phospholipid phosphatase
VSDVLGGAMIGIGAALIVSTLYPTGNRLDRWLTSFF